MLLRDLILMLYKPLTARVWVRVWHRHRFQLFCVTKQSQKEPSLLASLEKSRWKPRRRKGRISHPALSSALGRRRRQISLCPFEFSSTNQLQFHWITITYTEIVWSELHQRNLHNIYLPSGRKPAWVGEHRECSAGNFKECGTWGRKSYIAVSSV